MHVTEVTRNATCLVPDCVLQQMSTDEGLCEVGDAESAKRELAAAKALRERIGCRMVREDPRGQTAPSQISKSNSDELPLA